jgi:hypothetical protein
MCPSLVAPTMGAITPGRLSSQASATWAGGAPRSAATCASRSAARVGVGRVEEHDAAVDRRLDDRLGRGLFTAHGRTTTSIVHPAPVPPRPLPIP